MSRRRSLALAAAAAVAAAAALVSLDAQTPAPPAGAQTRSASGVASDVASYVNPLIGTANGGNVFPGAVVPFGMLAWSPEEQKPDTRRGPDAMSAAAAGGYQHDASRIRGFSLTHVSGTGCRGASGDVPFMPIIGAVTTSPSDDVTNAVYASDFKHEDETAKAGYYGVTLASGIHVELSATARTGAGRFTYPAGAQATMLVRTSDSQVGSTRRTQSPFGTHVRSPAR